MTRDIVGGGVVGTIHNHSACGKLLCAFGQKYAGIEFKRSDGFGLAEGVCSFSYLYVFKVCNQWGGNLKVKHFERRILVCNRLGGELYLEMAAILVGAEIHRRCAHIGLVFHYAAALGEVLYSFGQCERRIVDVGHGVFADNLVALYEIHCLLCRSGKHVCQKCCQQ